MVAAVKAGADYKEVYRICKEAAQLFVSLVGKGKPQLPKRIEAPAIKRIKPPKKYDASHLKGG